MELKKCGMKKRILFLVLLTIIAIDGNSVGRKRDVWLGGGIGVVLPSNIGSTDLLGYNDVASTGFMAQMNTRWFYNRRLTIGGELIYAYTPQDDDYWKVLNYGEVTNHYSMALAMAQGHYYFSHDEFRPYLGMGFGISYLSNQLVFNSNYTGTTGDASVSYYIKDWKPVFAPEAGFLLEVSKTAFLYINARFQVIPNMKPTYIEVVEDYGYPIDVITQNPHGHQNHFSISVGILFKL